MFDVLEVVARLNSKDLVCFIILKYETDETCTDILIKSQAANATQRILIVWPGECAIKNVNGCRFDLFRLHDLDADRPSWILAVLDRLEQILDMIIWV